MDLVHQLVLWVLLDLLVLQNQEVQLLQLFQGFQKNRKALWDLLDQVGLSPQLDPSFPSVLESQLVLLVQLGQLIH